MSRKNKREDDLDTETTFANMNVDGFRWYDPTRKKKDNNKIVNKVSRKEYWRMVRGAYAAYAPFIIIFLLSMVAVFVLMYFWLK